MYLNLQLLPFISIDLKRGVNLVFFPGVKNHSSACFYAQEHTVQHLVQGSPTFF